MHFPKEEDLHGIALKKYDSLEYNNHINNLTSFRSNQMGGQKLHKKNSYAANIAAIDIKVLEGISQMKKIYG